MRYVLLLIILTVNSVVCHSQIDEVDFDDLLSAFDLKTTEDILTASGWIRFEFRLTSSGHTMANVYDSNTDSICGYIIPKVKDSLYVQLVVLNNDIRAFVDGTLIFAGETFDSFDQNQDKSSGFLEPIFYLRGIKLKNIYLWLDPVRFESIKWGAYKNGNGVLSFPNEIYGRSFITIVECKDGVTDGLKMVYEITEEKAPFLLSISNYSENKMHGIEIGKNHDGSVVISNVCLFSESDLFDLSLSISKRGRIIECYFSETHNDLMLREHLTSKLIGKKLRLIDYYQISSDLDSLVRKTISNFN